MTRTTTLWSLLLLSAALALGSCTKDATEQATGPEPEAKAASKLVFSSANAVRGELLVCFGEEAVAGIESSVMQVTRSGGVATRSGIADFDAVLGSIGVKALQRLFPVDERNEERTRAAGLHRWYVVEFDAAADADLVIECVAENMAVKKELLAKLDALCKDETVFASNTSSLSITEMGQGLKHHLIGMHFFNPVPAMKLVEVIAGGNTPAELVDYIKNLSTEIGKTPVVVNEAPGFVVNKILIPYCNEGVCVLQEGVASAEDIDIAMQLGCNHPMGPLHLGDLIGWDVVLNIMDVLFNETHDSKYRANVLIRKMVRAGKLGIKSGEGFFNYNK